MNRMVVIIDPKLKEQIEREVRIQMKDYWVKFWSEAQNAADFELFFHDIPSVSKLFQAKK